MNCEKCLFWIGWAGKITDFGWYAPCTCEESANFLKVTRCDTTCSKFRKRKVGKKVLKELRALGYMMEKKS